MAKSIVKILFSIILILAASAPVFALFMRGGGTGLPGGQQWYTLPIGGGGNLLRLDVQNDGVNPQAMVVTTDTCGAYLWNASGTAPNGVTGTWKQIINPGAMPASYVANGQSLCTGMYALAIAPSNTLTMYMTYNAFVVNANPVVQGVYKTINGGASWALTNFSAIDVKQYFADGDTGTSGSIGIKQWGQRIAIDPSNANNVIISTGNNGLFYTTDGGSTWSVNATIPTAAATGSSNYSGYTGLAISKFNTNHVFAFSYGNGIYRSTTGVSGTFSKINSVTATSVTGVIDGIVDPNTGFYYIIDQGKNVWQFNDTSATWTQIYSGGDAISIAVDPNTANHLIYGTGNGTLAESTNGTSFGTQSSQTTVATGDVLWLGPFTANINILRFDPVTAKKVYTSSNRAYFTSTYTGTISNATTISWQLQTRGIEQLVSIRVIAALTNVPLVVSWDTALSLPSFTSYPSTNPVRPPPGSATALAAGQSIDWCSSSRSNVVMIAKADQYGQTDYSGYSSDGGVTWSNFGAQPNGGTINGGGNIACSTPSKVFWSPDGGVQPYYATNCCAGAVTWNTVNMFPGMVSWAQWDGGGTLGKIPVCADRSTSGTYFAYWNQEFYKSTDDGHNFSSLGSPGTILTGQFQIKCTDGQTNDFWFTPNNNAPAESQPCGNSFYHYNGSSILTLTNVECVYAFGFGVSSTGSGYPALYIEGWVNVSGTWTYGIWRSDNANSGGTAPSWTQIGYTSGYPGSASGYPANVMSGGMDMSGDPNIYSQVYRCTGGAACAVYR